MSRTKRFAHSLFSGYILLAVNIIYTLVQGRMLLHYIKTDNEVGLWAVAIQLAGYFLLLDLGMSGSVGRILIDHKDDATSTAYGSTIKTGFVALLVQGALIALGGAIISRWLPEMMNLTKPDAVGISQRVPLTAEQADLFRSLVAWQCVLIGVSFAGRMSGFILEAHQRYDVSNYAQAVGFGVNLLTLWWCFEHQLGLYSLLWSNVTNTAWTTGCSFLAVWRLKFLPRRGCWGRVSRVRFRELFGYATDIFLLAIGNMLITASQVVVVGWTLGLAAAGVWTFTTKTFTMAYQLIGRIYNYSSAALAEMIVRGELERLRARFRDLVVVTAAVAALATAGVAAGNFSFLKIWTKRMEWGVENDFLMAVYIFTFATTRCHVGLVCVSKELRAMKFIYVAEGVAFVTLAWLLGHGLGFAGIILSGICTNTLFSGAYGIRCTTEILQLPLREILFKWMSGPFRFLALMLGIAAVLRLTTGGLPAVAQLLLNSTVILTLGGIGLWKLALPGSLQVELLGATRKIRTRLGLSTNTR